MKKKLVWHVALMALAVVIFSPIVLIPYAIYAIWNWLKDKGHTRGPLKKSDVSDGIAQGDNWERFNFHGAKVLPACGKYRIQYIDQRGKASERDIVIKRVYEADGKHAMDAFCTLRGQHRSFVNDRIQSAVDLDTGEIVQSVAAHAVRQFNDSGEGRALAAIGREWLAASLLSFICRADGRMLKAERGIVADYFKRRCPDIDQDDASLDTAIKDIGAPDEPEFRRIIAGMKSDGDIDRLRDIHECAVKIIATQKSIDPMETAALEKLRLAIE